MPNTELVSADPIPNTAVPQSPENVPPLVTPNKKPSIVVVGSIVFIVLLALFGGGFLLVQKMQTKSVPTPTAALPSPQVTVKPLTLTLDSPKAGELAVNSEILVTGKTLPNTTVTVFTETDQTVVESDVNGNFETTMKLSSGINSLNVTAFSDSGEEKTMTMDVVYDSEI